MFSHEKSIPYSMQIGSNNFPHSYQNLPDSNKKIKLNSYECETLESLMDSYNLDYDKLLKNNYQNQCNEQLEILLGKFNKHP